MYRIIPFILVLFAFALPSQSSAQTFDDVPLDHWAYSFVETLAATGITAGCGGGNYCPASSVTRAQMAVFLERGMRGSNYSPPAATGNVFFDVGASDFAAEQLSQDGITSGCGNINYCPNATVTRDQMAVFLLRAKYGTGYSPPAATGVFGDVDLSHWAVHWIEALAAEGITAGCGNGNFCPEDVVTRAQMAVFLVRTFDLVATPSSDANLEGLETSAGILTPAFVPTNYDYTVEVGYLAPRIDVTPYTNPTSTILVNGEPVAAGEASAAIPLPESSSTIVVIDITAEDGVSTAQYTLEITRQSIASFAQQAYAKASNTEELDLFGHSVALHGDTLAVGAFAEDSAATGINGDQADNSATNAGAVYVFTRDSGGTWSQQAYIKASNTGANDQFGKAVALYGDTLAVGAGGEEAVYVFTRDSGGSWSQQAYLKASNGGNIQFGGSIALHGDTLAVGARNEGSAATGVNGDESDNSAGEAGAVYVFTRDSGGSWSQQAYVKASNTGTGDYFGSSVALHGDTLAVGAISEDSAATGIGGNQSDNSAQSAGAVYVFTRDDAGAWSQQAYVKASNTRAGGLFGNSVTLHSDTLAVGSWGESSAATGVNGNEADNSASRAGAVYVFKRDSVGVWSQQAYIKASNADQGDQFGISVALYGDNLAVGAPNEQSVATGINGDQANSGLHLAGAKYGAVYLFTRDSLGIWSQQAYVKASNTDVPDLFNTASVAQFGHAVALHGDTLAVSAVGEDSAAEGVNGDEVDFSAGSSGAVYVFR